MSTSGSLLDNLIEAIRDIDYDYMTSSDHHQDWVLIPKERFDRLKNLSDHINLSELGAGRFG